MRASPANPVPSAYFSPLVEDLALHGLADGDFALVPGSFDFFDGPQMTIDPGAYARLQISPENPCDGYRPEAGLVLAFHRPPLARLPLRQIPWAARLVTGPHPWMALQALHVNQDGAMTLCGKVGGRHFRPFPSGPQRGPDLREPLQRIDLLFKQLCSEITKHPLFSMRNLLALDRSSLCLHLPGGPAIEFDPEGRLPFSGLRARETVVRIGNETVPTTSEHGVSLCVTHVCDVLHTDGSTRSVKIELSAKLGPPQARPGVPSDPPAEVAAAASSPPSVPPAQPVPSYVTAIYEGLMDDLPIDGTLGIAQQRWTDLGAAVPDMAELLGHCKIWCEETTELQISQEEGKRRLRATQPILLTIPAERIPVRPGWLRWLLSKLLVLALEEAVLAPQERRNGKVPAHVTGTCRLQLGKYVVGRMPVAFTVDVPLPRDPRLAVQIDGSIANILREYTFSPLVNISHVVDIARSNVRAHSTRTAQVHLADGRSLHAKNTSFFVGRWSEFSSRVSLEHAATVLTRERQRDLQMAAVVTLDDATGCPDDLD